MTTTKTSTKTKTPKSTRGAAKKPRAKRAAKKSIRYVPSDAEIKGRAHEIYLERGSVDGHDKEDWLRAEVELCQ